MSARPRSPTPALPVPGLDDEGDALADELLAVKLIERTPGVPRLDHASGMHDDRVVALGLAVVALDERAGEWEPIEGSMMPPSGLTQPSVWRAAG